MDMSERGEGIELWRFHCLTLRETIKTQSTSPISYEGIRTVDGGRRGIGQKVLELFGVHGCGCG